MKYKVKQESKRSKLGLFVERVR